MHKLENRRFRAAANVLKGKIKSKGVSQALVVPGSGLVKRQAEEEGLHEVFLSAGFEWRDPGCSMCLGMNSDRLNEAERCASTSNRNFEGRQGRGVEPIYCPRRVLQPLLLRVDWLMQGVCKLKLKPFSSHTGLVLPFDISNVDTDLIIPKQYLKSVKKVGFGPYLFDELRYLDSAEYGDDCSKRKLNTEFILNKEEYKGVSVC